MAFFRPPPGPTDLVHTWLSFAGITDAEARVARDKLAEQFTMESAITVKGQATIPKEIREHLGLKPGDRLKFFLHPDGTVVLLPKVPARSVRGIVRSRRRRPVTLGEMTKAIAEVASGSAPRAKRR